MESYAAGETTPALLEETIGANLERIVAEHGDREALVEVATGRRWTYASLDADVNALARGLIAAGIAKGDRVGIWAPNCAEWTLVQYATAKIGAIVVNVNPAYRTHELAYALNQSGLRMLISAEAFKTSDYRAMVEEVREGHARTGAGRLHRHRRLDRPGGRRHGPPRRRGGAADEHPGARRPDQHPVHLRHDRLPQGRDAVAPQHPQQRLLRHGDDQLHHEDRLAIPVPFYHCFGMVMGNLGCTTHGATMVIPGPGFDPGATLKAVQDERCTGVYGVPTMFIAMQNHPDFATYDLSSLRTGIMAGSICPVEVMKHCVNDMHMAEASIAYGMTETSPVSCQTRSDDDLERRTETIGKVHPHVEIKIVDPATGKTVERGETGELCTRGYSVMIGYWDDQEKTDEAIDADGLDAHRRPRGDARGRLLQHRRPHQGHGDPGWGEHLPARDRGVPLHPPRRRGRAGDRRP